MRKLAYASLILLVLLVSIPTVYAEEEDEVNLSQFPDKLAEMLNIPLFAGQILASAIVLCLFLLPTLALSRNPIAHLLVGMASLSFTIALGWLPVWIFVIEVLLIAFLGARKMSGIFGESEE